MVLSKVWTGPVTGLSRVAHVTGIIDVVMKASLKYKKPLGYAFATLAVGFIVSVVVANWGEFIQSVERMQPHWLILAGVFGIGGVFLSTLAWRSVVHAFGFKITVADAVFVTFISQLGKYIPGGVWPIVAGSELGARAGVPRGITAITLTVQLAISVATACFVALGVLVTFPVLTQQYVWELVAVIVVAGIALTPPVMKRVLARGLRIIRPGTVLPELRSLPLLRGIGWSLLSWVAFGIQLWSIVNSLGHPDTGTLLLAISGYALAWVAGFLAVIAPAGAGVREAILALVLAGSLTTSAVLGVVLVSRLILVAVDVVLFAFAFIVARPESGALASPPEPQER